MKPPQFEYAAPGTFSEALELLSGDPDAKVIAGGQSLVPLLNFRLATPSLLVDLRRIPGLDLISREDARVRVGAMVRQRRAEESPVVSEAVPLLIEALRHVAHPQIRSRGTIGGSIAHADPAAELPAVLVALDGRVRAEGPAGSRWIDAADLFETFFTTSLVRDEVLAEVEFPAAPPGSGAACVEIARRAGDYAICGALAQATIGEDGRVGDVRVALFGIGPRPQRASAVEEALRDELASPERVDAAARAASEGLTPVDDLQGSSAYRRHLARVVTRRALEQALARVR